MPRPSGHPGVCIGFGLFLGYVALWGSGSWAVSIFVGASSGFCKGFLPRAGPCHGFSCVCHDIPNADRAESPLVMHPTADGQNPALPIIRNIP